MSASFIQEMTAVQEAFDMWKVNHYDDSKIPTNGIVQAKDVRGNGRLYGEIAYYRRWSESEDGKRPEKDVLNKNCFDDYDGDLLVVPRGIEDLYYLNNKEVGINNDKVYIIDAVNSMIYRVSGYTVKNVDVHSLSMYREVTGGSVDVQFASAEVEGGGDNIKYAGEKYYKDKNGNYVDENGNPLKDGEEPIVNPYGFELYTDFRTNNIYKLYNNGELYGKGIKGTQLNTSPEKMAEINVSKFSEFNIPSQVSGCKKIISGRGTVYFIDKNDYLWALGDNTCNKLGLTKDEQIEYTGREAVKLNVDNKKVNMCWDFGPFIYVRTVDNSLYSMGGNFTDRQSYILGNGSTDELETFTKINFEKVDKIEYFASCWTGNGNRRMIMCCSDKTYYALGISASMLSGAGNRNENYKFFTPIFDGWSYVFDSSQNKYVRDVYNENANIAEDIKKVCPDMWAINILKVDNTLWHSDDFNISKFSDDTIGSNIKDIFSTNDRIFCIKYDNTVWAETSDRDSVGMGDINITTPTKIKLPEDLVNSGIKEVFCNLYAVYYLGNNGVIYGSSSDINYLGTEINEHKVIKIPNSPKMETFYELVINVNDVNGTGVIFKGDDGKLYSIGNSNIMFGNLILEKDWTPITDKKVKKVVVGEYNSLAIIDFNDDLYVCGEDGRILGLNISTSSKVPNLTKVDDPLINGNVSDVSFSDGTMNVLLKNGDLYATGLFSLTSSAEWPNGTCPGWSELEHHYKLVKINIPEAIFINSNEKEHVAIADNKIYTWGFNYYNSYYEYSSTPIVSKFNEIVEGKDVKKIFISKPVSIVLLNDGQIYIDGGVYGVNYGFTGVGLGNGFLENKSSSFENKKITDFSSGMNVAMFLADSGEIYGYGCKKYLGINDDSNVITDEIQKLSIGKNGEKVSQVVVGNTCAFAVTEDGKVYGTGSNSYGTLGRWIGIDRKSPNSRYKTAFEWVECPELEI